MHVVHSTYLHLLRPWHRRCHARARGHGVFAQEDLDLPRAIGALRHGRPQYRGAESIPDDEAAVSRQVHVRHRVHRHNEEGTSCSLSGGLLASVHGQGAVRRHVWLRVGIVRAQGPGDTAAVALDLHRHCPACWRPSCARLHRRRRARRPGAGWNWLSLPRPVRAEAGGGNRARSALLLGSAGGSRQARGTSLEDAARAEDAARDEETRSDRQEQSPHRCVRDCAGVVRLGQQRNDVGAHGRYRVAKSPFGLGRLISCSPRGNLHGFQRRVQEGCGLKQGCVQAAVAVLP
mmetsp:Transcript_47122/g.131303  ORF Transcript_47122/g.131303 Transcript_47122/m.131303 type:complete len:290 (-) Transcript_47122:201-1070(-)